MGGGRLVAVGCLIEFSQQLARVLVGTSIYSNTNMLQTNMESHEENNKRVLDVFINGQSNFGLWRFYHRFFQTKI